MSSSTLTVVQCWDDGVSTDARLTEILRRHGARATFNLNAGTHAERRSPGWIHRGTEVERLGWDEMRGVYESFTIANHSLTHPHLDQIAVEDARREIAEGRDRLQQYFGQPVTGFAYPFGTYNESVMQAVQEAGHIYARTTRSVDCPFPPENAMAFHPSCHFLAPDLWERYENARAGGVFYFWGHSFELIDDAMWNGFERMIERISQDPEARWGIVAELFAEPAQGLPPRHKER